MKPAHRALALLLCLSPALSRAQSVQEYLALRKKHGVNRPVDPDTLGDLVGKKVLEVKGTVQGVIACNGSETLLVVGPSGEQHFVQSESAPEWLKTGVVQARLLVLAERPSESSLLKATLLGAAPESDMAPFDRSMPAPGGSVRLVARTGSSTVSRHRGRPGPMPGDIPNPKTSEVGSARPGLVANLARVLPAYTDFVKSRNRRLSDSQAQRIAESILGYSSHFGVDPRLIVAIVLAESDFNPKTKSHAGAMGLGQLMPENVQELGLTDGYDIEQNLFGTIKLVRGHIDRYSRQTDDSFEALVLALAGYNAGDGAVKRYKGVPPYRETQGYVRKVIGYYAQLTRKG